MSERPLRVLFLDHTAKLAGGEIALLNLLSVLDRERIDPHCLLFEDGPLVGRLQGVGIRAEVLPLDAALASARKDVLGLRSTLQLKAAQSAVGFVRNLRRRIRDGDFDLIYCNSLKSDLLGGLAARLAGVPCVWHVHDRIENDYLPTKVVKAFRWAVRRLPHGVVANSQCTLETLKLAGRVPATVAYPGVCLPAQVQLAPEGPPIVAIVGRLAHWKGQHIFLDAAARVRREVPEARFHLIGSALFGEEDYERQLREQVDRLGLSEVVTFRGFQSDIWAELARATIVAHASIVPEPFGQVVVEAMAAGRPVVATDAGGVRETMVDGETGLLVPSDDADALAVTLIRLLADRELRNQMAAAGRARVTARFAIDQTAHCVTKFLESLGGASPTTAQASIHGSQPLTA